MKRILRWMTAGLLLLVVSSFASGTVLAPQVQAAGASNLPAGFVDELVIGGLLSPRAFVFTPDGRILIAERGGESSSDINVASVRVFKNGALLAQRAVTLNVCGDGERGFLGLALDPNFSTNGYLYVYYTRWATSGQNCAYNTYSQNLPGPRNRISRLTMLGDTIDPASEVVLIDNMPSDSGIHNAGDLHFGADGYLYASVGDSNLNSPVPPGSVGIPIDLTRLGGKILRIKPDPAAPNGYLTTGNPFDTAPNAWRCGPLANPPTTGTGPCKEIFAYGFRNPFRFTIRPGTSTPFVGDVGGGVWEEIDEVTIGGNYGYPEREGPCPGGVLCISIDPPEPPPPPPPGLTNPIYYYPHLVINANVDSAVIMGAFYTGASYPVQYQGNLFFADYVRGFIRRLVYDAGANAWSAVTPDFATGATGVIGLRAGPAGDLFYLSFPQTNPEASELRRIRYLPGSNQPPVAVAGVDAPNKLIGVSFNFTSAGSYDPDGNLPLTYTWNFGDGSPPQVTTNLTIAHAYGSGGAKTVSLTVADGLGLPSTPATLKVFPGNTPATATISLNNVTNPARTNGYYAGDTWGYAATNVTDTEPLSPNPYSWDVVFHHRTHSHPFLSGLSGSNGQFTIPPLGETDPVVWYAVVLRITDAQGQVSTFTRNLNPITTTLNFTTQPGGGVLMLDGSAYTTPFSVTRVVGLQTGIEAPSAQTIHGLDVTFEGWTNGGSQSQVFAASATPLNLGAVYRAPFTGWFPLIRR